MDKKISLLFHHLQSHHNAQRYLQHCYQKQAINESKNTSYQNSDRFYYFLKHGLTYYRTGKQAPITIQPLLYYYGMMHLIKACLLTKIPDYPERTTLLAHGLSTRKQKKQNYQLLQDEVKIQQKGLFPYFSTQLFGVTSFTKDRFIIQQLLKSIPELDPLYLLDHQEANFIRVNKGNTTVLTFPNTILDKYHLTLPRFIEKLQPYMQIARVVNQADHFLCQLDQPISLLTSQPFSYSFDDQTFYFPVHTYHSLQTHEVMIHYILLYHLSMLVRYEADWWGDFVQTQESKEYPLIVHFLKITFSKIQNYCGYYLEQYL